MNSANYAVDLITGKLEQWIEQAFALLPNLVVAVVVLLAFALVGGWVRRLTARALESTMRNQTIARLIARMAGTGVLLAGIMVALGVLQLEKTVTSLLAGAGVVGLALAFAFQDIAANLMSGIMMSVKQPFGIGDMVETNGVTGVVRGIDLRNTELETATGQTVLIPNRKVFEEIVTNYTRLGHRRVDIAVGVSYADDLDLALATTRSALEEVECRNPEREIQVFLTGFGGSSIDLVGRFWIPFAKNSDYLAATSEGILRVKAAYDAAGLSIPFPIRTLDFGIEGGATLAEMLPRGERSAAP